MRKRVYIFCLFLVVYTAKCSAQSNRTIDSLCRICNLATGDTERIVSFNNLAAYYYRNQFIYKADSVLKKQIRIAELVNDKNLLIKTYFDNPAANIVEWSSSGDFDRVVTFLQKGIEQAKRINDHDYIAIGYARLATVLRKRGKYNQASQVISNAQISSQDASDSVKAIVYIETGNLNLAKEQFSTAGAYYNNAFEIATKIKNHYLESEVYRCLASLNEQIGERDIAKDFLLKSVQLDRIYNPGESLIRDYIRLASHEAEDDYINMAISLSDSLHLDGYTLKAKEVLLAIYMNRHYSAEKMLSYLNSQPELKQFYMRGGGENYYYERGEIYLYGNNPDSALYYFGMVENYMLKNYDVKVGSSIYLDIGDCYYAKKDIEKAIDYYLKALSYFKQAEEGNSIVYIAQMLSSFYEQAGDFKIALYYSNLRTNIKDSLAQDSKTKEVALLDVERLRKQDIEKLRQQELAVTRKRNLQYMSITIAIVLVFIGMLVMGMFPVSKVTIRILGYFFFISLFEFIVLVLDNNVLHTITHGEPLRLWLIKIGLIGILVPIQHFLEHRITKFLESRQLLKARRKFSFKTLWSKKKKRHAHAGEKDTEEGIEKDTAVL